MDTGTIINKKGLKMKKKINSRRDFLRKTSLATAALSLPSYLTAMPFPTGTTRIPASEQLNLGLIGCRGMGWSNLQSHLKIPGVNCIALADIDQRVLEERAAGIQELTGKKPIQHKDYRELLDNKDIDAVIVATPDHWHCLNAVHALQAGKHVYVEKPLANSIEECNLMVKAAKRYGKIVQVGQWQRSGEHYDEAVKYVQ